MSKQISHFMPFFDVEGRLAFSGAENHLFTLMQGQKEAGHDVELVMVVGLDGARLQAKAAELCAKGIQVTLINHPVEGLGLMKKFARLLILKQLYQAMLLRKERVIHIHPITNSGALIVLAAKIAGCPYVVLSYHNNEPFMGTQPYKFGLQQMDKVAKRTIAISGAVLNHLIQTVGLDAARTKLVYYGIEIPQSLPDKATLRQRLGLTMDDFAVGLVGRLTPQKDIPTFLRTLKRLPHIKGVVIGGGEMAESLKAEAQALGLTNCIFAGPHPDGADLISCLDIMVLPSSFEGLGLVLLEAMVRHVPIIGSRGGAIPEITEQGKLARLFDVGDDATFAQLIEELRTDTPAREALAATAYARALEKFTVPAMVKNTDMIYSEAMAA